MTHVLVAAVGSAGDMYPFLRQARALLARGHRVTFIGVQAHADAAMAAGVPFHGLGTEADYLALLSDPDLWHPRRGFGVIWRGMRDSLDLLPDTVAALAADGPCVLLAHPLTLPGAALARARRPGLRIVAAWLAPTNLRSVHDPLLIGPLRIPRWLPLAWRHALWRRIDATVIDPVAVPDLNTVRARYGLAPVSHFIDHIESVADAHLTLFPRWFAPAPPDWPRPLSEGTFPLYDPFLQETLAPELATFLRAGSAPIVFTPGSGNRQATRWFERALAATQRLGRRAIFLTSHREQVPARLPEDVLWLPYVPLRALLPSVAALVHHGGIGTTAEALRAGVPQLVVPMAYDQFDNGARVRALGAGQMLAGWRARPRTLATTLSRLLDSDAVRAGCARAAALAAADAAVEPGPQLERLLGLASR
ncbi:MAG: glycosyltransferase [Betaproteobacteria bacterium]